MKMMEELTLVDPLTFEIKRIPYRDSWKQYTYRFLNEAVQEIRGELKGKDDVGKLKIICDYLVEELREVIGVKYPPKTLSRDSFQA